MLVASDYLEQAAGIRFRITFDLELDPDALTKNQIWRPPADSIVVTVLDARYKGRLFGATKQDTPFVTWLVVERMPTTHLLLHVVEHELLHAVGCDHVSDRRAVLYEYTTPGVYEAIELADADRNEIDRALAAR